MRRPHHLNVQETAAAERELQPDLRWEVRGDLRVSEPGENNRLMPTDVESVRDGTRVVLSSESLDVDMLVELARSLVPAPIEPPRLAD